MTVTVHVEGNGATLAEALQDIRQAIGNQLPPSPDAWQPPPPPPQPTVLPGSSGRTLVVGAGGHFGTIAQALQAAEDGDTVSIMASVPREPFVIGKILRVVGNGVAWDFSDLPGAQLADHGKAAIVTMAPACAIEGFRISGAGLDQREAGLVAGIRNEADGWVTIRDCQIHTCQNGIASSPRNAVIEVFDTILTKNGLPGGVGHTHNIYVGEIHTLKLSGVAAIEPVDGHAIKTRGARLVVDGGHFESARGRAFDIANGGEFTIDGAILEKPPRASNAIVLGYAAEGTQRGASHANRIERCIFELHRHANALLSEAGTITLADCTFNGNPLITTGAGTVAGLPQGEAS